MYGERGGVGVGGENKKTPSLLPQLQEINKWGKPTAAWP